MSQNQAEDKVCRRWWSPRRDHSVMSLGHTDVSMPLPVCHHMPYPAMKKLSYNSKIKHLHNHYLCHMIYIAQHECCKSHYV